jgi:hypothetical protein
MMRVNLCGRVHPERALWSMNFDLRVRLPNYQLTSQRIVLRLQLDLGVIRPFPSPAKVFPTPEDEKDDEP